MKRRWNRGIGWVTVFVVLGDWVSKFLILNWVALHERVSVFDEWFYLVRVQNRGVAFGILNRDVIAWRAPLVILTAGLVLAMLVRLARSVTDTRARWELPWWRAGRSAISEIVSSTAA